MRFCFVLLTLMWSLFAFAKDQDVLIVHSYHQGFFWTDDFQSGIEEALKRTDISIRVVYLDTKRLQSEAYLKQLFLLYQTKFNQESFRAIVVSDNNALNLMQRLAPSIGNTPVVFGGINNYSPEIHDKLNATGVIEDIDLLSNISLIERLQPEVKKILVVSDYSTTGESVREQVNKFLDNHPAYKSLVFNTTPESHEELLSTVSTYDAHEAVLFWVYYRDKDGRVNGEKEWVELNQQATAPIYMVHDLGLGHGAVGGVLQSGQAQGHATGEMLIQVLQHPSLRLPDVRVGNSEVKLDYQALLKWGLGAEGEPASVFLNKPMSFTSRYQQELKGLFILALALVSVIIFLVYYLSRIKKSEQVAVESQALTEMVFDQSYHFIGLLDEHGCLISSNNKLQTLLHHQGMQEDLPMWNNPHWEKETASRLRESFDHLGEQTAHLEAEVWSPEQGFILLEVSIKPIALKNHRSQYLFEARDITRSKETEEKLFQREANLSHYYDQQPVMMITLDDQDRIQQVNEFAETLLGHRTENVLGRKLQELYVHSNALTPRQVLLQPAQVIKGVWRREIEYRHADGRKLWIRENIRPLVQTGHLLVVGVDITEMKEMSQRLEFQAKHDLLTDTFNRNHFELELSKALKEVASYTRTHAMLYLDLDQLKVLNDTAGHDAGDAAIQFCASMLEDVLPYNATLARMGGDEFAVLLRDCTERDAKLVAEDILRNLEEHAFIWEEIKLHLTCSIGIRLIDHTASSPKMVHAQADTACHAAKEEGRNRYNLYCLNDEDLKRREQEMESVNLVHNALANNRVELFAQRITSLHDGDEKMHFEILVRIKNAQEEYISPAIFMPASERYNVAHLIDKRVVSQTLDWLESHESYLEHLGRCSINLSGHSVGNHAFIAFLLEKLKTTRIPNNKICFEITETAAIQNLSQAIHQFERIKSLGCLIALDDFGSGLSSFGYLKKLPVDIVKIDGLFVREMDKNSMDKAMVKAINELAKQMGKVTVAEFVENSDIIDILKEMQVDYAQGYVIGKPKPLAELVKELANEL